MLRCTCIRLQWYLGVDLASLEEDMNYKPLTVSESAKDLFLKWFEALGYPNRYFTNRMISLQSYELLRCDSREFRSTYDKCHFFQMTAFEVAGK